MGNSLDIYKEMDKATRGEMRLHLTPADFEKVMTTLREGFENKDIEAYELKGFARLAFTCDREAVYNFLKSNLDAKDWSTKAKAANLMESLAHY